MGLEDDIAFFEQVPPLAALGKQALRILAIGAETRRLQSGAVLFYAGELADGGYVIQEGSLLLEPGTLSEGKEVTVGPGTLIGELRMVGLFSSHAYTDSIERIPFLRHKVEQVSRRSGNAPDNCASLRASTIRAMSTPAPCIANAAE